MKINWVIEGRDINLIKDLLASQRGKLSVENRIRDNVEGPIPYFDRDRFWKEMILCLVSTQQRWSRVDEFGHTVPFLLNLNKCSEQINLQEFVESTITNFGGLRRSKTIGKEALQNYKWLNNGGWEKIEKIRKNLIDTRRRSPQLRDKIIERKAAEMVMMYKLRGFGPKQSRNLWQSLGYTRFEIPIDSRIVKWSKDNDFFPFELSAVALSDENYYNFVMDGFQEVCKASKVYPCVLDAAIWEKMEKKKSVKQNHDV